MLVLSRKPGQKILIDLNDGRLITVTVVRIGPNSVRIGIDAPGDMKIIREELGLLPDDGSGSLEIEIPIEDTTEAALV